ncbi:hypothetical protein Tco_0467896 [Tanacetum coccineum]
MESFVQRCTCKSCGKGAHIGYNCPPKAPIISNPEPCNQTIDELPQTLPSFDPTCYSEKENSLPYVSKPNFVDDSPNVFNPPPQPPMYSYEFCRNDARYGHYCTPQVPFIYPEPCYNQDFNFPQDFHDFQQQYLCCKNCGGPHETFQCQPMNEDYYHERNSCYDSNSFGFDQFQPPQYTVNHPIFNAQNELLNSQNKIMEQMTSICDMVGQYMQKKEEDRRIAEDQAAKDRYWKIPICYDDDEDDTIAVTPVLSTEEPVDSLIMEDEHLDTIPATESDEVIKSTVENLVPIPSESEDFSDNESECDVPDCDDSQTTNFSTESDYDLEEDIVLLRNLVYDNSTPRPPKELNLEIADMILESLSPSPILVEDSDSHMEEIDLFLASDDSMPPGIENDDRLEGIFQPPDVEICFDFEPDTGVLTTKVVKGISEHYVLMPNILPTLPTFDPDLDFTPSHDSLGSGNKIFDPGIFIEVQSKRLLSWDEFSISFIHDPLCPVFDLLLSFSSENKDKVFNPGFLKNMKAVAVFQPSIIRY